MNAQYDHITGYVTATMTIGGQCSTSEYDYHVVNANISAHGICKNAGPCTDVSQFNAQCLTDGIHTIQFSTTCGFNDGNGGCNLAQGSGTTTFSTDQQPHVSISIASTATPAIFHATVPYEFPGTDSWQNRHVVVRGTDPGGGQYTYRDTWDLLHPLDTESGTIEFDINAECYPNGVTNVVATATACNGDTDRGTSSFSINHRPMVSMDLSKNPDASYKATITYNFPDNNSPPNREIILSILPTPTESGSTIADWNGALGNALYDPQGTVTWNFPVEGRRVLRLTALACQDRTDSYQAVDTNPCAASPPGCPSPSTNTAAPHPVQLWDGMMWYTEHDPLPDDSGVIFRRTYRSTHYDVNNRFGLGWFSVFDAGIVVADPLRVVYTENDDHAVFAQQLDGTWLQVWPTGRTARGTLTGSEAAGFSYREPGSSIVRKYGGAGSHRLIGFLDLTTSHTTWIDYDANGTPIRAREDGGRWSSTITTSNGLVTQIALDGRPDLTWNYSYNGARMLTAVTLAGAPAAWRGYEYDKFNSLPDFYYLARVRDSLGNILEQHTYDGIGRALSSLGPSGDITSIQYNNTGTNPSTTVITRADGSVSTYQQSFAGDHDATLHVDGGCASCGGHDLTYAFDAFGHMSRVQDGRGYVTEFGYDANGQLLLSVTRALAPTGCDPATDANHCLLSSASLTVAQLSRTSAAQTTLYAYTDQRWPDRPTQVRRESPMLPGQYSTETLTYDATTGQVLTRTITGVTGADAHTESHVTTTTLYDGVEGAAFAPGGAFQPSWLTLPQPMGLPKTVDAARTDVADITTYVYYPYDPSVTGTWRGHLAGARNAAGHITRFEDYDVFGRAATVVDPNSVVSRFTFDALGRVLTTTLTGIAGCDTTTDPLCATDLVATNQYANMTGPLSSTTRPSSSVTVYAYDSRARITTVSRGPSTSDLREQIAYTYDAATQQKATERYLINSGGTWTETKHETYAYDASGRLATMTHPDSTVLRYTYDATDDLTAVQDERHTTLNTSYTYDPARRLATVTQTLAAGSVVTRYAYDAQDNLTSVTDPNTNVTTYSFDDFGRMQQQVSPVSGTTSYTYDLAANLTSSTDANSATSTRTYDVINRVLSATATRSGAATEATTWIYDDATSGNYGRGRLASMTDPSGSTAYAYERRGLLRQELKTIEGNPYTTRYGYDADGNRSAITYPSGRRATYTFDFAGRPITAALDATTLVSAATYLPFGPTTSMALGNGTTVTRTFDTRYRITENKLAAGGSTRADYTYSYDNVGNILGITDALDNTYNRTFGYDDLNRLTTANTGSSLWGTGSYQYDAMGNMTSLAAGRTATFAFVGTTPKLSSVTDGGGSASVGYDGVGNELTVGGASYAYSARNLLRDGDGLSYTYDGRGVRVITAAANSFEITALDVLPSGIEGPAAGTGTVTLGAPAPSPGVVVTLSTANAALVRPRSFRVSVATGQTTAQFPVDTTQVSQMTDVRLTAGYGGSTQSKTVTVIPPQMHISSVTLNPTSVEGPNSSTGTITTDKPAPTGGALIALSSSNTNVATVPASVTVAAGSTSATFTVSTVFVSSVSTATITARYDYPNAPGYYSSSSAVLTVNPPPIQLQSITLSPTSVVRGNPSTGTATLNNNAPTGGAVVTLSSSNTNVATVPPSVTVPAGTTASNFTVSTTRNVSVDTIVAISGTYAATRAANLTVTACTPPTAAPPTLGTETVWFDDAPPSGTTLAGTWTWDTTQKASGTKSHTDGYGAALHEHGFHNAPNASQLSVATTDQLVTYVLLSTCDPPQEIMLEWEVGADNAHRAFWGANLIAAGTLDTPSRISMGALPPLGQWVRLTVSVESLGLGGKKLTGATFKTYGGQAWFDRSAKGTCTVSPPPIQAPSFTIRIWFDDALPTGAVPSGTWVWDTAQHATGLKSNTEPSAPGNHAHSFTRATTTVTPGVGENLAAYVLASNCDPPREIMLEWYDGSWEHRAFWGEDLIPLGTLGTVSRRFMGAIPTPGQWIRVIVPAATVGLENRTLTGMSFRLYNGKAWFDTIGVVSGGGAFLKRNPAAVFAGVSANFIDPQIVTDATSPTRRYSFYSPELNLLAESQFTTAASPTMQNEYVWFNGEPLAQVETATSIVHYYFNDHLGTPVLTSNSTGAVDWRVEREPYGPRYAVRLGLDNRQPLAFPGQEEDSGSDRNYNIFRWYRSGWGRYSQADPLSASTIVGFAGSLDDSQTVLHSTHPYGYGAGNPVSLRDPLGLQAEALAAPFAPFGLAGPAAAAAGGAALAACLANPQCRREIRCFAEFAKDMSRCTSAGLCSAFDEHHSARVNECMLRSWSNLKVCRRGWPPKRPFPDPWPGKDWTPPGSPQEPPDPGEEEPLPHAVGW